MIFAGILLTATTSHAVTNDYYVGILGGYGSTNWSKLATTDENLQLALPSGATDSGATWGVVAGDNINENFGAEFRYQKFADSKISFSGINEYSPDFEPFTMTSHTESYMLLGKLRVPLNKSFEIYSLMGAGMTYRKDQLNSLHSIGAAIGAGAELSVTTHWHNSLEFYLVTGNATINIEPALYYQPFLTSFVDKVSYYF
jgi:opacity protein-like surface antigen